MMSTEQSKRRRGGRERVSSRKNKIRKEETFFLEFLELVSGELKNFESWWLEFLREREREREREHAPQQTQISYE